MVVKPLDRLCLPVVVVIVYLIVKELFMTSRELPHTISLYPETVTYKIYDYSPNRIFGSVKVPPIGCCSNYSVEKDDSIFQYKANLVFKYIFP